MIREERKQKKNKEHFIHIGPKLKAARQFCSLNLNLNLRLRLGPKAQNVLYIASWKMERLIAQ